MKTGACLLLLLLTLLLSDFAQPGHRDYSVIKPADWFIRKTDTLDYAFGTYMGRSAFFLKRNIANYKSASVAYPKALRFKDGIIELDMAIPSGKDGFAGFAFRIKDDHHYETLYFRPGSSGTTNAVQYMPEKDPAFNWWNYEADKYQAKAVIPLTDWFHVKAVVKGRTLKVFLNNTEKPVMTRDDLDTSLPEGAVGFWLGNCSSGAFRNLHVEKSN